MNFKEASKGSVDVKATGMIATPVVGGLEPEADLREFDSP
jgi:hypothetical protein